MVKIKLFKKGDSIYGAKNPDIGPRILSYTRNIEKRKHKKCNLENLSWFGPLKVAKQYKNHDKNSEIFRWSLKKELRLYTIDPKDKNYIRSLFRNYKGKFQFRTLKKYMKDITREDEMKFPYLRMSMRKRAYYEFSFVFGYMSVSDQKKFLKMLLTLIKQNKLAIFRRNNKSIYPKLLFRYLYGKLLSSTKKGQRYSIYTIDKDVLNNLCLILPKTLGGVYFPSKKSVWYPSILSFDLEEYILFEPFNYLEYKKNHRFE